MTGNVHMKQPQGMQAYILIHSMVSAGRRQDSERWWFTAAQSVLENADLRPEVRRFVETSVAEALAAPPSAQASRQPAGALYNSHLAEDCSH